MAEKQGLSVEMIYVDDGSRDATWAVLLGLAQSDPRVKAIRLRRSFGKAAALTAGIKTASAPLIATLDGDLQDDPAELPKLKAALAGGLDVVSGWKAVRQDPWHKVFPSRVFNWLVSALTGVRLHDHNCGLKLYRAEVFREVRLYGELHRFIPVLAAARGFKVGEVVVAHRPRMHGRSKFGVERFLRGFLDLMAVKFITGYGQRPQHLLGFIGLIAFAFGLLGLAWLAVVWLIRLHDPAFSEPLHNRPLLVYSAAGLLLGFQMMSIGLLAALINAYHGQDAQTYSVAETTFGAQSHEAGGSSGQRQ
jgi:dolichol-phosphate mannosyltransferase